VPNDKYLADNSVVNQKIELTPCCEKYLSSGKIYMEKGFINFNNILSQTKFFYLTKSLKPKRKKSRWQM